MTSIASDNDDTYLDAVDLDSASDELAQLSIASNDADTSSGNRDERQRYRRQMDARRRLEQLREEKELASLFDDWGD